MITELLSSFKVSMGFVRKSVEDLSEEQLVMQPPGLPNHGMWTLGHLTFSCQGIATELGAEPWLPGDWESTFGYGSTPSPGSSNYLAKVEMLEIFDDSVIRACDTLSAADESTLNRPLPDEALPKLRHLLVQVMAAHTGYHAGQLAVWRKAIGMPSAGVFI